MRYIVLSFDDGRKDFFTNAFPILEKYGLRATLNVITDYIGKRNIPVFASGNHECIDDHEIVFLKEQGIEIACHSANHTNDIDQIIKGIKCLEKQWGGEYGFASPGSEIYGGNFEEYATLVKDKHCKYIRSGTKVKRDGLLNAFLYLTARYTGSLWIFRMYNRKNILSIDRKISFYPSVTCNRETRAEQIISLIKSLKDRQACILMFHSILYENDPGFEKDKWFNSAEDFTRICSALASENDIKVVTNMELHDLMDKGGTE